MLKSYSKFLDILEFIIRKIIGVLMILMVAVMFYQVVLRYCFNKSNIWSEEITRYMFVYVSLLGSFVAIRKNSHLKVDFFVGLLKGKAYRYFTHLTSIGVLGFLIYLTPLAYNLSMNTMKSESPGLKLPMGYVYLAVPIGCVLMIMGMIEIILQKIFEEGKEEKK